MSTATRIGLAMIGALSVALPAGAQDADLGHLSARGPTLKLAQARGAANEGAAWEAARKANSEDAYIRFLEEFPAGDHASEARQALDALSRPADPRPGSPSRDLARDPPAGTTPDPGAQRPPAAPDPAPVAPAPAAPPGRAFAWNYDERGGVLTVTANGQTRKCLVVKPSDYAGIGVYLADGKPRVNFDRQLPGGRPSSDDLLLDAFCAEASIITPPAAPSAPPPASEPEPQIRSTHYTIRLCNKSSETTIDTAVAHFVQPTDSDVTVVGWWIIQRGQCVNVRTSPFGPYESMNYYVHAHTSKYSWPGKASSDLNLCTTTKAFSRKNTSNYTCRKNETLRYFRQVKVTRDFSETAITTFNFND